MATRKGLEPSTSGVTGRRSNQLNYRAILSGARHKEGLVRKKPGRRPPGKTRFGRGQGGGMETGVAPKNSLAGAEGLEPSARGFGDRCSTS